MIGTSILFNLGRLGVTDTLLLEKDVLGSGSTGRSQAICRMHYSNPVTADMAWKSLEIEFGKFIAVPRERKREGSEDPSLGTCLIEANHLTCVNFVLRLHLVEIHAARRLGAGERASVPAGLVRAGFHFGVHQDRDAGAAHIEDRDLDVLLARDRKTDRLTSPD